MKGSLIALMLVAGLLFAGCYGGSSPLNTIGSTTPATAVMAQAGSETSTVILPSGAQATLKRFMVARIRRQDQIVLTLLTDALRAGLTAGIMRVPVLQVSNPCWYRYEVLTFVQPTSSTAVARVRIYEHFWPGDNAGGPPRSWEQEIGLVETAAGWLVDQLGPLQDQREELKEPHGPTTSACNMVPKPKD